MIEQTELLQIITLTGLLFFILGIVIGPWFIHKLTKLSAYFIRPKYLIYKAHKTFKKQDRKY